MKKWKTYIRPHAGNWHVESCEAETKEEALEKFRLEFTDAFRIDLPFEAH